jgi:hypothetical protein
MNPPGNKFKKIKPFDSKKETPQCQTLKEHSNAYHQGTKPPREALLVFFVPSSPPLKAREGKLWW